MGNEHFLSDKNHELGFKGVCWSASKALGKIPLAGHFVDFACDRVLQEKRYRELHPLLMDAIKQHGRNSKISVFLMEEITQTASFGARRENFKRYFVKPPLGWQKLPANPKKIPYGHW